MLIGAGLPNPTMMLFNRLIRSLFSQMNRHPIDIDNDELHYNALEAHQRKNDKVKDTHKDPFIYITGATEAVQWKDRRLWTHGMIVKPNNDDHTGCFYTI